MSDTAPDKIVFITDISGFVNIPSNLVLDSNIYNIIKEYIIQTYEKKCGPYGYVDKIYKLVEYNNNISVSEELNNNILFNVTFTAKIYNPIKDNIIECIINNMNKHLLTCENGPLKIIINMNNINNNNFKLNSNKKLIHVDTDKVMDINDKLYVKIIDSNYFNNDTKIFVYAELHDIKNK